VIGAPIDFFAKLPADAGLHLVPIPFSDKFSDFYSLGEFSKAQYPTLIAEGDTVTTVGVPAVLAVYNWQPKSDRHRRVQRLVERMFTHWEKFQSPPRHPKWRDVNLAATVPGWTRWPPAEELLRTLRRPQVPQAANTGAKQPPGRIDANAANLSEADRERLFQEFQNWQRQQRR
jgi:hypothetical protein